MIPSRDCLFRYTSDSIVVIDANGTVTAANPRAEALLQRPLSELMGESVATAFPDFGGSRAEVQMRELAASRLERRIDHFSPTRYTWFEIRIVPEGTDRVLFVRDVTDRMRQTRTDAVREAVRQIVMEAPVAISITRGPEHRYELVNTIARRLLGDREIEGRTARAAFPEIDASLFAMLDEVYTTARPMTINDLEISFDRDGSGTLTSGIFDVTYQPLIEPDGAVSGILSVSVETTAFAAERRRISAQSAGGRV